MKKIIFSLVILVIVGMGSYLVYQWFSTKLERDPNFAHGNGRIEATEINIAARLSGKVEKILVLEGEKVKEGQILVAMQTNVLVADLAQAEAKKELSIAEDAMAEAKIASQEATLKQMKADLEGVKAIADNAETQYYRYKKLVETDAVARQIFDKAEKEWRESKSSLTSQEAKIAQAEANLKKAHAEAKGAKANILAAAAEIDRIKADIDDSILKAPLAGRIQYRIAEPGEVLSSGGRALNMIDLTDVYMTFFLPEAIAGKVKIGADVRIVLDAIPQYPLPAKVSYVATVAQFTPKTVETSSERQKLMFRIKAHIDRNFLDQFMDIIKTGLPGVAWVKLEDKTPWPKELEASAWAKEKVEEIRKELQKQGLSPDEVINSQTKEQAKTMVLDVSKYETGKPMTQEQQTDIAATAAKDYNDLKKERVEKAVSGSVQKFEKEKNILNKEAEFSKKNDEKAKKTIAPMPVAPKAAAPKADAPKAAAPAKDPAK